MQMTKVEANQNEHVEARERRFPWLSGCVADETALLSSACLPRAGEAHWPVAPAPSSPAFLPQRTSLGAPSFLSRRVAQQSGTKRQERPARPTTDFAQNKLFPSSWTLHRVLSIDCDNTSRSTRPKLRISSPLLCLAGLVLFGVKCLAPG